MDVGERRKAKPPDGAEANDADPSLDVVAAGGPDRDNVQLSWLVFEFAGGGTNRRVAGY